MRGLTTSARQQIGQHLFGKPVGLGYRPNHPMDSLWGYRTSAICPDSINWSIKEERQSK